MKTMLVTGASSGIGRALAVRAARAGYAVFAVGRNPEALDALRAKIESENGFVHVEATDVAVASNACGLVARALSRFGSINVLVNNAGFVSAGPLSAQSDEELQRQFGTHVIGPVALVREALDALRAVRGHVVVLGSGVARVPIGGLGAYPPAKAAIRSATAILRRELRPLGVAVTYVDPGAVDTPFMKRAGMPGAPVNLLVSPEAVARKILIAVADRPRELNAVGWQTAFVGLAELFPRLTDMLLQRAPGLVGGEPPSDTSALSAPTDSGTPTVMTDGNTLPANAEADTASSLEIALRESALPENVLTEIALRDTPAPGTLLETAAPETGPLDTVLPEAAPLETVPSEAAPPETVPLETALLETSRPQTAGSESASIETAPTDAEAPAATGEAPTDTADRSALTPFEAALEPHRRRMEKLNLREGFVRGLLVPDACLDPADIALRWAGMPNKNERAITQEVLDALADSGFLERSADHTYRVVRTP